MRPRIFAMSQGANRVVIDPIHAHGTWGMASTIKPNRRMIILHTWRRHFAKGGVVRVNEDHFLYGMDVVIFFTLLLVAEVLGTVGGFGSSMLVMPLAGSFLPFDQALGLTALFHVFSNGAKMILFRTGFDRKLLLNMGVPAVIGVLVGARLTIYLDGSGMRIALGIALLLMSAFLFAIPRLRIAPTRANAVLGGTVSGLIAGLVGTGGAVRGAALAAFGLQKEVFIATSAWIDMGVDLGRSVVYWSQGYMHERLWQFLPGLIAVSFVGSYLGKRILAHVPQAMFQRIVLVMVFIIGLITIITAVR